MNGLPRFVRVIPNDYRRVRAAQRQMMNDGMTHEEQRWRRRVELA